MSSVHLGLMRATPYKKDSLTSTMTDNLSRSWLCSIAAPPVAAASTAFFIWRTIRAMRSSIIRLINACSNYRAQNLTKGIQRHFAIKTAPAGSIIGGMSTLNRGCHRIHKKLPISLGISSVASKTAWLKKPVITPLSLSTISRRSSRSPTESRHDPKKNN